MMTVGAVVVHFRFWPDIQPTIDALLAQTRPPDEIIILDDHSGDGSAEQLAAAYPDLPLTVAPENRGCVANMNAGISHMLARGVDAILLLTHETQMEPETLEKLSDHLDQDPEVGAVGPLMGFLSRPEQVFSAGGALVERTWQTRHRGIHDPIETWRASGAEQVEWLDTACVLLRTTALRDIGQLDERYFHYFDDTQLGVQLTRRGWRVDSLRSTVARQEPGGLPEYYRVRNRLGFLSSVAPRKIFARELAKEVRQVARDARQGNGGRALALAELRGMRDFALGRWGRAPAEFTAARRQ